MQNIKQKITLAPLIHKGNTWIAIQFPHLPALQQAVRKTREIKWSQSNKCWYMPFTRVCYNELLTNIKPFAAIDNSALKQYKSSKTNVPLSLPANFQAVSQPAFSNQIKSAGYINLVNRHVLADMHQTLILKAYSPSTIKTYLNEMRQFLQMLKNTAADTLPVKRIKDYLQYCFQQLKLSENTLHSRINALKFYYEQVLKKDNLFWEIPRPKKPMLLPKLLNERELAKLFNALKTKNIKLYFLLHIVPD